MSSSPSYLQYVLDQLTDLNNVRSQKIMGEYIIYVDDIIVGGIYDDRLLIKPVSSASCLLQNSIREVPYPGAKEMILVDEIEDKSFLNKLFKAVANELSRTQNRL